MAEKKPIAAKKRRPKILQVISVNPTIELETGDNLYQIVFGKYISKTTEVVARIPDDQRQIIIGNQVPVSELVLLLKTTRPVPYEIGSKWELSMDFDGNLTLAEAP